MSKISVIGSGAFGTGLAVTLANAGHNITLWGRDDAQMAQMAKTKRNTRYLPDIALPTSLTPTHEFDPIDAGDLLLMVVPAQTTRSVLSALNLSQIRCPVIMCAKGIEVNTTMSQTDIVNEYAPALITGAISGPGFATEIASGKPTALTLAIKDQSHGIKIQEMLSTPTLRLYLSNDVKGVQLGGALKNVYAIACGIVNGAQLGESAQAALLTRGFAELKTLASKMGAKADTLAGLSGFGDMVLSCTSMQSRNFAFGHNIGASSNFTHTNTVEGFATAKAVETLAGKYNIEMPICSAVSKVLENKLSIAEALTELMSRPLKQEI